MDRAEGSRGGRRTTSTIAVVVVALVAAACGGGGHHASTDRLPTLGKGGFVEAPGGVGTLPGGQAGGSGSGTTPGGVNSPAAGAVTGNAGNGSESASGAGVPGSGASGVAVGGAAANTAAAFPSYAPAHLYSGAADTQGITTTQIKLCMHAALILGNVFNETAQDISTYWRWRNARGGVIGRQVSMTLEDDQYTPQGAQTAAQACEQENPFFVMGGIGFDQDPVVRQIAEQNHFIYLYTMADVGKGTYTYSFTGAPTTEQAGAWLAEATLHNDPGPYGAVYVNDAAWVGGWDTYKSYMSSHGGRSVLANAYPTTSGNDTSEFTSYIVQLQAAGVKTVLLWMNALAADAFVEQASSQGYNPAYVTVDGFDLVTSTVGAEIDDKGPNPTHPALAVWITPAFDPNNLNVPWGAEERTMLAAYAQYDAGHTPDDIDWMAWLAFKQAADLLTACGNSCTRNDIVGIFDSGWKGVTPPLCPVDFSANHNFGGQSGNLFRAHREGKATVWQQTATCTDSF